MILKGEKKNKERKRAKTVPTVIKQRFSTFMTCLDWLI